MIKIWITDDKVKVYRKDTSSTPYMQFFKRNFDTKSFMDRQLDQGNKVYIMQGRESCQVKEVSS